MQLFQAVFSTNEFIHRFKNNKDTRIVDVRGSLETWPDFQSAEPGIINSHFVAFTEEARLTSNLLETARLHDLLDE